MMQLLCRITICICSLLAFYAQANELYHDPGFNSLTENSKSAMIAYDEKVGECSKQRSLDNPFPVNDWMLSLDIITLKHVLGYLHNANMYNCQKEEMYNMIAILRKNGDLKYLNELFRGGYLDPPTIVPWLSELDLEKLKETEIAFPLPFHGVKARNAYKKLLKKKL